jgi:tRNA dimethylallyltransferase
LTVYKISDEKNIFSPQYYILHKKNKVAKKKVIVIAGPTGVGKTSLAIDIAKNSGGEIISADSMQVYRCMDIGTAKATTSQQKKVPHHLIDIRNISDEFNVVAFYTEAHRICDDILKRGKVPILVGGSGFYIHAFLYGPPQGPPSQKDIRDKLEKQMLEMGPDVLYEKLQMLDPVYAATITERDRHKIVRALEIISITKKTISSIPVPKATNNTKYDYRCWFVYMPRERLYSRVDIRCDEMIQNGFVDEVTQLDLSGIRNNATASQAIGYKQCLQFLRTKKTDKDYLDFMVEFKKVSRHYVKRQMTWFKKEPFFRWIDLAKEGNDRVIEYILQDFEQG